MITHLTHLLGSLATSLATGLHSSHPGVWLHAGARLVTADRSEIGRYAATHGSRLDAKQGLMILGGLLVLLSSASLVAWLSTKRLPTPSLMLFNRLARDAGLGKGDRWLLYKMARRHRVPKHAGPLTLLLCPGTLGTWSRHHVRQSHRSRRHRATTLARAASIRRHLFAPPHQT
ncbi:MAG: hypothetical protein V3V20_01380 [Algisphaera sp.]